MDIHIHCEDEQMKLVFKEKIMRELMGEITGWFPNDESFEILEVSIQPEYTEFISNIISKLTEYMLSMDIEVSNSESAFNLEPVCVG